MLGRTKVIKPSRRIEKKIAGAADENRALFSKHGIFVVNLIGSPGSGKTTLLERTLSGIGLKAAVIEGDITTSIDAERIRATGTAAVQIETGGACHLDPAMVAKAVKELALSGVELLFIENVGNLVCPSGVDLGEDIKVAVTSVAEGDEKPAKYPALFIRSAAVVINKIDLLPYVEYSLERATRDCRRINSAVEVFPLSSTTGEGTGPWLEFLRGRVSGRGARR
jgi:hydrogenase nickel incorporation protein HypB